MPVMAIDQHLAPQHQRVAASFGQQTRFQRGIFIAAKRVDERAQRFINSDGQFVSLGLQAPAPGAKPRMLHQKTGAMKGCKCTNF